MGEGVRSRWVGWRGVLAAVFVILLGVAGFVAWSARPRSFAGPAIPDPNGYDTLSAAGKRVTGPNPANRVSRATREELRSYVEANAAAFEAARPGFDQDAVVPLSRFTSFETALEQSTNFRSLERLIESKAVLDDREKRTTDALQGSLDLIRLAHAASHGGLLTDRLMGEAFLARAMERLDSLSPRLSADDARQAIAALERFERNREPLSDVADRDLEFALSRQGWKARMAYAVGRRFMQKLRQTAIKAAESSETRTQTRMRFTLVKLALRAYELDHPDAPTPSDLHALVPAYLPAVPLTPDNARPITLDDLKPEPETTPENVESH